MTNNNKNNSFREYSLFTEDSLKISQDSIWSSLKIVTSKSIDDILNGNNRDKIETINISEYQETKK